MHLILFILFIHSADGSGSAGVPWDELRALPELNPPNVMPRGNVGTPLATFMQLIRSCKLPSQLIRKLQLEFPKSRTKKRYGAVALDYGTRVEPGDEVSEGEDESIASRGIGRRIRGKGERRGTRSGDPGDNETESDKEDDIPPVSLIDEIDNVMLINVECMIYHHYCDRMMIMMLRSGRDMKHSMMMLTSR